MEGLNAPIRTTIWGSCVSRDTFSYLPDSFALKVYVARQSWISAATDASPVFPDIGAMPSEFQARMTQGDLEGNALRIIGDGREVTDLLLLDLCDERLGVVKLPDGQVVTRSVEKLVNKSQQRIDDAGEVWDFGSNEHFEAWQAAACRIYNWLRSVGLAAKTLILAPDWAVIDDAGKFSPTSFGRGAAEANVIFDRYYAAATEIGFRLLRKKETLAASQHIWGPAPFHYHEIVYQDLVAQITSAVQPR